MYGNCGHFLLVLEKKLVLGQANAFFVSAFSVFPHYCVSQ